MSHFTKLAKAKIINADAFEEAAKELKLKTHRNAVAVSYGGQNKLKADVVVNVCQGEDIGLVKNKEGTYDMMSDWSYRGTAMARAAGFNTASEFQDRLIQLTSKYTLVNHYRTKGFMARVTETKNKELDIELVKY